MNVEHTAVAGEFGTQFGGGSPQFVHVGAGELVVDGLSGREPVGGEAQFHRIGDRPDEFPPAVGDLVGAAVVPLARRGQLDDHFGEVAAPGLRHVRRAVPVRRLADAGELIANHGLPATQLPGQFPVQFLRGLLDLPGGLHRHVHRHPFGHFQLRIDPVAFHGREEAPHQPAARQEGKRNDQYAEADGGGDVALGDSSRDARATKGE